MQPRYLFENGILKTNPASRKEKKEQSSLLHPNSSLAIISSADQLAQARKVMGAAFKLYPHTDVNLHKDFEKQELPLGFLETLSLSPKPKFRFFVVDIAEENLLKVEERLHDFINILKYKPFESIEIKFFMLPGSVDLERQDDESISEFSRWARLYITGQFDDLRKEIKKRRESNSSLPRYTINHCLEHALCEDGRTFTYLLTDDLSNDKSLDDAEKLLKNRKDSDPMSLTIISFTDDEKSNKWWREMSRTVSNTAFIEGFHAERKRVADCQGKAFSHSKGYWLLSQLFSIEVEGYKMLRKAYPVTGECLSALLGRESSKKEYDYYFNFHPKAEKYRNLQDEFFNNKKMTAKEIIEANKSKAVTFKSVAKSDDLDISTEHVNAVSKKV